MIVVIGAGLAGLSTALMLAEHGQRVRVLARGIGGLPLSPGTLDIAADAAIWDDPAHPYAAMGRSNVEAGVDWLRERVPIFAPERDLVLPTAVGALRPSAYVQKSMVDGAGSGPFVVVGIEGFRDFSAQLVADNLSRQGRPARSAALPLLAIADVLPPSPSAVALARAVDHDPARLGAALGSLAMPGETILVPAILGLDPATFAAVRTAANAPLAEVPLPPPSVPGLRIHNALLDLLHDARVDVALNTGVLGTASVRGTAGGTAIDTLTVGKAGGKTQLAVDAVVDAAGSFDTGNISVRPSGRVKEMIFGLPLAGSPDVSRDRFADHAMFRMGVRVNARMQPLSEDGQPALANLYAAGTVIGGAAPWREHSGEGIALGSAWAADRAITEGTDA